ncbi:prostacyclin synthase-like [Branchiostoma floridae x Branchiostoma belcheri]
MGNVLGTVQYLTSFYRMFAPNPDEDFAECNNGVPCRAVTGNKAVQSIMYDFDRFQKEEFTFSGLIAPEELTDGVCLSALSNGKAHEKYKGFLMDVISKGYGELPACTARSVLSNVSQWGKEGPVDDFEFKLLVVMCEAILPTIYGQSAFDVKDIETYVDGITSGQPRSRILQVLLSWRSLDAAHRAKASVVEKIQTSERYQQLMDLAKSHGMGEHEATMQLLISISLNGVCGSGANLVTVFACLNTLSEEDREELREEALAAMRKHGGLTPEALQEMPKVESLVLEALRFSPSPGTSSNVIAVRPATCPYTTQRGEQKEAEIKEGEVVFMFSYWALRDPTVFDKADEFVWRRFLGPEGQARRENHIIFNGRLVDSPSVNNHMCPGKDVAISALKGIIAILNTFYGWELEEAPYWTGTKAARIGKPDNEMKIKSFWLQRPEDLKEIFPSYSA